MVWRYIGY